MRAEEEEKLAVCVLADLKRGREPVASTHGADNDDEYFDGSATSEAPSLRYQMATRGDAATTTTTTAYRGAMKKVRTNKFDEGIRLVLTDWVLAHKLSPYPSEDEKRDLMTLTGLDLVQLNNFMSNARRRKLKKRSYVRPTRKNKNV